MTTFADLDLRPELLQALTALGYEEPTPIQREAIPPLLAGKDLLGQAATGTGKTAAFALPILQNLKDERAHTPSALVLVPTRELAVQVSEAMHKYGRALNARVLPIYGGQAITRQLGMLKRGVDVVVATPGRALDHIARGTLDLTSLDVVVLDEADEMFDMGFAEDLEAIFDATPATHQTVLFSATMPARIAHLARRRLTEPERITVARETHRRPGRPARPPERLHRRPRPQARRARPRARRRGPAGRARLLPHARRGRPARRDPQRPRLPRRGAARRHDPGSARPRDGAAAQRDRGPDRGHRRRRPRAGHRSAHARRQLRRAVGPRHLHAPHRARRPGGTRRRRDHARRAARAPAAEDAAPEGREAPDASPTCVHAGSS